MRSGTAVVGVGMVTPLGATASQTCAAIRAGLARFEELPGIRDVIGEPIVASRLPAHPAGGWTKDALGAVMGSAIRQALDSVPAVRRNGTPIRITLLDPEPDRPGQAFVSLGDNALKLAGLPANATVRRLPAGNAGIVTALIEAEKFLAARRDGVEVVLGFDSLVAPESLLALEKAGRLKRQGRPRGLIPGEACAALAVRAKGTTQANDEPVLAHVLACSTATEPVPVGIDEPCLGTGLTTALTTALREANWGAAETGTVYCDLNGEVYRANEWMLARCRALAGAKVTHPADAVGDVGSAVGPLLIGLAACLWRRGVARTDRGLIFCSSDGGLRGCVALSAR